MKKHMTQISHQLVTRESVLYSTGSSLTVSYNCLRYCNGQEWQASSRRAGITFGRVAGTLVDLQKIAG